MKTPLILIPIFILSFASSLAIADATELAVPLHTGITVEEPSLQENNKVKIKNSSSIQASPELKSSLNIKKQTLIPELLPRHKELTNTVIELDKIQDSGKLNPPTMTVLSAEVASKKITIPMAGGSGGPLGLEGIKAELVAIFKGMIQDTLSMDGKSAVSLELSKEQKLWLRKELANVFETKFLMDSQGNRYQFINIGAAFLDSLAMSNLPMLDIDYNKIFEHIILSVDISKPVQPDQRIKNLGQIPLWVRHTADPKARLASQQPSISEDTRVTIETALSARLPEGDIDQEYPIVALASPSGPIYTVAIKSASCLPEVIGVSCRNGHNRQWWHMLGVQLGKDTQVFSLPSRIKNGIAINWRASHYLVNLGDINSNGYGEFMIYELGHNDDGAANIYELSADGINNIWSWSNYLH